MGRNLSTSRHRNTPGDRRLSGNPGGRRATIMLLAAVALVAVSVFVFAPVGRFSFVSWDDPGYVTENEFVRQGLTLKGLAWALTSAGSFYWHPVTWLSHMADVQMFGMQAGAHHVTNLVLHLACTLLLFGVLQRMTGRTFRSALVAALFGIHPLHVESVAWIAERKDVLSGVFWMLSLWAYVHYVRHPSRARYGALVVVFALGLMSKPTLVTLPLILLLLDIWPLRRFDRTTAAPHAEVSRLWRTRPAFGLVVEKIPLFAVSVAASTVTFVAQLNVGAVASLERMPARERLLNGVASSVAYIGMALWPERLAAFYPFRPVSVSWALCCLLILTAITCLALRAIRSRPYLTVGWLWYVITLLPVIGLIQVGSQAMADRFTYLPLVGLMLALVWGVGDLLAWMGVSTRLAAASAVAAVCIFAVAARVQTGYWKDSETLWQRAVDAVPNNDLAHANLGFVLASEGRATDALAHFSEALRIMNTPDVRNGTGGTPAPEYAALIHHQIGLVFGQQARWPEAIAHFRLELQLQPQSADGHHALGQALASNGQLEEAIPESRRAVELEPGSAEFRGDLASILYRTGNLAAAIAELEQTVRLTLTDRSGARWHYNLAAMLNQAGRPADAIRELQAAVEIDPDYEEARQALLALKRSVGRAQ